MPTYRAVSDHPESGTRRGDTRQLEPSDDLVRSGLYRLVPEEPAPDAEDKPKAAKTRKGKDG